MDLIRILEKRIKGKVPLTIFNMKKSHINRARNVTKDFKYDVQSKQMFM